VLRKIRCRSEWSGNFEKGLGRFTAEALRPQRNISSDISPRRHEGREGFKVKVQGTGMFTAKTLRALRKAPFFEYLCDLCVSVVKWNLRRLHR